MADRSIITAARLCEVLHYNPETGIFTWLIATGPRCRVGERAGAFFRDRRPRRMIGIDGKYRAEHKLAWLWMTGEWPVHEIDHIDNNATNNRWRNLRPATREQNTQNARRRRDNTSGYKGVSPHEGRYAARVQTNGKRKFLGYFDTPEEAYAAVCKAAQAAHGEFYNPG